MPTHQQPPHARWSCPAWLSAITPIGSSRRLSTTLNSHSPHETKRKRQFASTSCVPPSLLDNAPPPPPQLPHPSNSNERSPSRSRTLLKFLKPKIRLTIPIPHLPSPSSPTFGGRAPSPLDTQAAKEKREAALRERGLLPPLKQNKDLSRLEREQDRHLPVASPVEETAVTINSPTGIETVSPADLIKRRWEAKNHSGEDDERERFKSFRYGASSLANESRDHQDMDVQEFEPLSSSQQVAPPQEMMPPTIESLIQQDKSGFSSNAPQIIILNTAGKSRNSTVRNHEVGQLSPTLFPLPPSPAPTPPASPKPFLKPISPSAIDLYSPVLLPLPLSPTEFTAKHGSDETNLDLTLSIPTGLSAPIISLSPVTEEPESKDVRDLQRKVSVSESRSSSLATPSLETSSRSTMMSSLGTVESSPKIRSISGKSIPMIVESPIEEGPLPELAIPNTIPEDSDIEVQQDPFDEYQKIRGRRKKRTLFGQDPSKQLRVSASLTNMRRSVANTLSLTKSSTNIRGSKQDDTFDASHLPPSPTFSLPGLTWTSGRRNPEDTTTAAPRQSVFPTLHSHASILLQTSAIEDEEARRVAELAFLG